MKSKRCPIIVRVRFEGKKERCVHSPRKERDEHVIINDSFFLGRTRDDAPPQSKGREREREREREHNQSTNHPAKRESDVEHRGVDQKRLLLDALCFLERLFQ